MSSSRRVVALLATALSASVLSATASAPAGAAPSAAAKGSSKVKVTVVTPRGVPAAVTLKQKRTTRVVSKRVPGAKRTAVVRFKPGRVVVQAPTVTYRGKTYAATTAPKQVRLAKGRTTRVRVVYRRLKVAQNVTVGAMTPRAVKVVWSRGASGTRVVVRRASGTRAVKSPRHDAPVKVRKNSATATGLRTGRTYTFTVFTLRGKKVLAAQSVTATPFRPNGSNGGFVAPSTTRVYTNAKTAPKVIARGGQALLPVAGSAAPPVGAGYILPPSRELPGGFIGVVDAITANGRYGVLRPAALDEVFDALYGSGRLPGTSVQARQVSTGSTDSTWLREPATRREGAQVQPSALPKCLGGTLKGQTVKLSPRFTPTGTFEHGFSKKKIFGKEFPTGGYAHASFNVNIEAALTVKTTGSLKCAVSLSSVNVPFQAGPVPMLFRVSPVAELNVTGEVNVKEIGYGGNLGAKIGAKFGLTGGSLSGSRTLNAYPLTPQVAAKTGNWRVGLAFGGDFVVGPGKSFGKDFGAVAGVEAQVRFFDGRLGPKYPVSDSRHLKCFALTGQGWVAVNLSAKAWFKKWSAAKSVELKRIDKSYGSAHFPAGCEKERGTDDEQVSDDALGDGVDKVEDDLEGSTDQWGRSDAFTPGKGAWILSTGMMAHIPGVADDFASTDLGLAGSPRLSQLSGFDTHDAVTYRVKLVPNKPNLHVRYLFASEEYPEYVNSSFNDVMGVFVDGQNCALVGGVPVSVNTINANLNADKYVPNVNGTTSMDGWTTPL